MSTTLERRLQSRVDAREVVQGKQEALLAERGEGNLSDTDKSQLTMYREELADLDKEIDDLSADWEAHNRALERSKDLRRAMIGSAAGVDEDGDGVVYRSMAAYARDVILTRQSTICSKIATQFGDPQGIEAARSRLELLKRTPANTLSSDVTGLQPEQHIAQIFQVIDDSRPLVESSPRATLERGTLTYPFVEQRPVVAVQSVEKTEAGNQKMIVSMETTTASTYLGGGDLSWQAINWSTPNALDLWFRLAAEDYAIKTEADAAQVLSHSAFTYNIDSGLLGSTPTFAEFMTAVGAGGAEVFDNSRRMANTVYIAVDRFWYLFGVTTEAQTVFANVGDGRVGPLRIVPSPGLDDGVVIVGDRNGMLVAETAGAPVELRVVEPAIGGVEVGIIGAFEAVVVDPGAFAMITTAS